ncbi:Tol-Pal system beta propeller repeat protein TolB [hydrothermal vent metagenome]|uniref:Tol-Pal system beta propeller repeat protein TolB n=1 Tax=hydrothermal vent metagenome TaxID=652676 RepID=A0A3B1C1D8_9ZZZZ
MLLKEKMIKLCLIVIVTAVVAVGSVKKADAKMDVFLHTQRSESRLIEIAIPKFTFLGKDAENFGWRAARIINRDLKFSGYFKTNNNYDFMAQASRRDSREGKVDFEEWRSLASDFLVKGNLRVDRTGSMVLEVRVYDLQMKKLTFSKRYIGPRAIFRQIAHQFSDDFVKKLIGEKGVARSRIAFISRVMGYKELFVMDYDGYSPRAITSDRSIVILPDWNPVSDVILFTTYKYRNPDLYAIDLKAKARYPISRKIGLNVTGEWSPNGKKVLFSLSKKGNSEIYICNSDGSDLVQLTHSRAIETSPTWSPDSKRIVYTSDRTGSPQIYIMHVDGSQRRRLSFKGGYNDGASWSPKEDIITYSSLIQGRFNIVVQDVRDGAVSQLTSRSGTNEAPTWSPNGNHIVFSSNRSKKKQIYIMNADGLNQTQVTHLEGGGHTPTWGPSPK